MKLQEFRDDFQLQLQQVSQKIQELTTELQGLQQQALKLQGACEAVDLIDQNMDLVVPQVVDFEEPSIIDVESTPIKRTTKK
jgi:uncharacterized protein (DUF3084 family)